LKINENIRILSEIVNELINSGNVSDIDNNKVEILFPFIEEVLGYDTTTVGDVIIAPAYTPDGNYKLDYGLRGNRPNYYKSCFKVVQKGSNFENEHENIKRCLGMVDTEFVVITDCFDFQFLIYDDVQDNLVIIGDYSLINPENCDQNMVDLIRCPGEKNKKQEYAVRDEDEYDSYSDDYDEPNNYRRPSSLGVIDDDYEDDEPSVELPKKKNIKKKKKLKANKKIYIVGTVILIATVTLLSIILTNKSGDSGGIFSNFPIIGNQNKIEKGQLDGTLDLTVDDAGTIYAEMYSRNIPAGANIKFEFINGTYKDVIYVQIGADGKATTTYTIPSFWDNAETIVMTYLRFDEPAYPQPSTVKNQFGEIGDKIIGKEGAPDKFAITFGKVSYDSQAVKDRLAIEAAEKEALERQERMEVFSNLEIRVDSLGNWKVLPKDFNMNEVNITESRNIYPQIFFDGKEQEAYFYLVCGTINQMQVIRFTDVVFYADGFQWAYQVSSNTKEISVTGGVATEWVYFHNLNTPTLVSDAKLLADSEVSKVVFKGDKIKEHILSDKEKNSILSLVKVYEKYFKTAPKQEWLVELENYKNGALDTGNVANSIKLNYIKKPASMLERDSDAEKELVSYISEIQSKRLNNQQISMDEETKLDLLMNRYREMPDDLESSLYSEIINATATTISNPNVNDLNSGYYKIYFKHNISPNIESGYLNEVYILPDKTMIVPIKTMALNAQDKAFASFKLSSDTFNEFISFIAKTNYSNVK
jgi:hypothetical protein